MERIRFDMIPPKNDEGTKVVTSAVIY